MTIPKQRCHFCRKWYHPHPRTALTQKACSKTYCQRKRKGQANETWRIKHPSYDSSRRPKIRAWAKSYPDYWKTYRINHPDYCQRDNSRRVLGAKSLKLSAKQDAISKISLDKLKSIQESSPELSAKQDAIHRRVDGILDYLFWKELSAKQDTLALSLPSG